MTQKKDENLSQQEAEQPQANSVFDFLYQDIRRVGSYLAQLEPAGHVSSVKVTQSNQEGELSSATIAGDIDLRLASLGRNKLAQINTSNSDILERSFDPLWGNALNLLNILAARGMIACDPSHATIGQFVLVKGRLSIFNLKQLSTIWNNQKLLEMMQHGIAKGMQAAGGFDDHVESIVKKNQKTTTLNDYLKLAKHIVDMIKDLPPSIQGNVKSFSNDQTFSFSLQEDYLTTTALDLFLKHGTTIQGEWAVLGILDAEPDNMLLPHQEEKNPFFNMLNALSEVARHLGRAQTAYGISPLLVFRNAG